MNLSPVARVKSVVVVGVAVLGVVAPSAVAATSGSSVAAAGAGVAFRFTFDNGESLRAGTRVKDASGHGRYGIVRVSGRGHLTVLQNGTPGRAAGFPRACQGCGRAIITVSSRPALNPAKGPFSFGASVRATAKQTPLHRDPNIVMKGSSVRGKWKLHLLGSRPRCVFAGAANEIVLTSQDPINNGSWHRVVCSRDGRAHRLFVDGVLKAQSNSTYSGKITSNDPVKVGGRAVGHAGSNDQFHGDLDNVFLRIPR